MTPDMLGAFFFALFTFTIIFIDLFWNRIRLGNLQEQGRTTQIKSYACKAETNMFFQEPTPDTSGYMIAGYAVAFIVMGALCCQHLYSQPEP